MKNSDSDSRWLRALEIKLTALPDNSTCKLSDDQYGCELVVRPNTIIHLTLEIASKYANYRKDLSELLCHAFQDDINWEVEDDMPKRMPYIIQMLKNILLSKVASQTPFVVQPIWKTVGKSAQLHTHCLDVFVWSSFAFAKLLLDAVEQERSNQLSRAKRAVLWIMKMLADFAKHGKIDPQTVRVGFSKQTDKAFALSGRKTNPYMSCDELLQPRIKKVEIKNIILGHGEKFLSPERRFDAILVNSPELFS